MHFVSVKHGSASIWYVAYSTFDIKAESCLTVTNCDFRTFRVKESFWAKEQSCITLKVSLQKWCPFFLFVLVDVILVRMDLQKRTICKIFKREYCLALLRIEFVVCCCLSPVYPISIYAVCNQFRPFLFLQFVTIFVNF